MAYFWTPCNVLSLVIILSIRSFTQCKNRVMWPSPPVIIIAYFVAGKFNISHFNYWSKLCETLCFAVHHSGHSSWHFAHLLLGSSATWPSSQTLTIEGHRSLTVRRNIEGKGQSEGAGSFCVPDGSGGLLKAQGVDMRPVWLAGRVAKKEMEEK